MADAVTKKVKVELLHPVTHDFMEFGRGVHEVTQPIKDMLLKLKDAITGRALAREPESEEAPQGNVTEAADSPRRLGVGAR